MNAVVAKQLAPVKPASPALPSISLVTCSYQQARYLEATIQSVLSQNYPSLEYAVIDGDSTDGSVDVIRRYQSQLADWVSEPDRGQTDALIKGFERTTGEIMGWLCSDDLLLPGALISVGEYFARNPRAMAVYGDALWIDGEGRYLRPKREIPFNRFVFLHDHNYIPQPSMFWRRSLYRDVGGLDRAFNLAMDGDLWDRFAEHGAIEHLPRYLSCMRCYPEQKTRALRPQARAENAALRIRRRGAVGEYFQPLLYPCAKALRVALKAFSGVYLDQVPDEHLLWLKRIARIMPDTAETGR